MSLGKNTEANLINTPYDATVAHAPWELFTSTALPIKLQLGEFDLGVSPDVCERNTTLWLEATFSLSWHLQGCTYLSH